MGGARQLGRYVIGERLGSGGLGEVYLAHAEGARGFRKQVVVKQVRRELALRADVGPLLLAEAAALQRLAHGNIVQLLDVGVDGEAPYLVMEFVDGASLAELLHGGVDVAAGLFVVESVCAALEHAHTLGLVHRDVTPANILVSRDGVVKLTDFGIAAVMATAAIAGQGTPGYAAPEQRAGGFVDGRADVYALGVVLAAVIDEDATLRAIAARAMAEDVGDRFQSAQQFAAALEAWRAERSIARAPAGLPERVRALQQRRGRVADRVGEALAQRERSPQTAVLPGRSTRRRWPWLAGVGVVVSVIAWLVWPSQDEVVVVDAAAPAVVEAAPVRVPATAPVIVPVSVPEPVRDPSPRPAVVRPVRAVKGQLRVNLVPWAEASVDGRDLGRTPIAVDLPAGRYTLVLANPELGQRRTREVTVTGGAATHITDW